MNTTIPFLTKTKIYFLNLILGIGLILLPWFHDYILYGQINLGLIDKVLIYCGISFIIGISIINFLTKGSKKGIIFICLIYLSSLIFILIYSNQIKNKIPNWTIIGYKTINGSIKNPIKTFNFEASNLDDENILFVADPIVIKENENFYMFFEAFNKTTQKGEIGMATSQNAEKWNYNGIVLTENFHLSFPFIIKVESDYYMIPESSKDSTIRIYIAKNFPNNWVLIDTILHGDSYLDNVIFHYNQMFWLFTSTANDNLYIYYSKNLIGQWQPHPANPILQKGADGARMAGRILEVNEKLYRFAQDDYPNYGNNIRKYEILQLNENTYLEKEVKMLPNLKNREFNSQNGIHTINILQKNNEKIYIIDAI